MIVPAGIITLDGVALSSDITVAFTTESAPQIAKKTEEEEVITTTTETTETKTPAETTENQTVQTATATIACSENELRNADSEICKKEVWLACTNSNKLEKSSNKSLVCFAGQWQEEESSISVKSHSATPSGFNPLIKETKISYKISEDAKVEIKILNSAGAKILTLIDNNLIDSSDDRHVFWNGTDSTTSNGDIVPNGTYVYKIIVKNPINDEITDIVTGDINVVYPVLANSNTLSPTTTATIQVDPNAFSATVAMQNATEGSTAGTGPGVLIYAIFPLAGLLFRRKR